MVLPINAVPYHWLPEKKHLHVGNAWTRGTDGKVVARHDRQRRRFVHPVLETSKTDTVRAEFEFAVEDFGNDPTNPMLLGLFHSGCAANCSSVTLRVGEADAVSITVAGEKGVWESKPVRGLKAGQKLRFRIVLNGSARTLDARLTDLRVGKVLCELRGELPKEVAGLRFDEIGIAQPDWIVADTPADKAHAYRVTRVLFERE